MPFRNANARYGSVAKTFHWLIALLVIGMLCVGPIMVDMKNSPLRLQLFTMHKELGLIILSLMILRVLWALSNVKPSFPQTMLNWEKVAARYSHYSFYVLLIVMPLSGWIMSSAAGHPPSILGYEMAFPGITPDKPVAKLFVTIHIALAIIIAGLLTVHVAGALNHHFIYRDNILRRMLPGNSKISNEE